MEKWVLSAPVSYRQSMLRRTSLDDMPNAKTGHSSLKLKSDLPEGAATFFVRVTSTCRPFSLRTIKPLWLIFTHKNQRLSQRVAPPARER